MKETIFWLQYSNNSIFVLIICWVYIIRAYILDGMVLQSPNLFSSFDKKVGGVKGLGTSYTFSKNKENNMNWL